MMPARSRLKWIAVTLTLTCIASSSFAQNPKKYLSLAAKEFKKGDYDAALGLYQTAFMLDSSMKQNKKFSEDVANYYEAQMRYGIAKATSAKNRGDLPEAWSWYVRVSRTSSSLPEVKSAGTEARRIHDQIAANYLVEAKLAEGDGRVIDAVIYANQARAYGLEDDAQQILNRYRGSRVRIDSLSAKIRTVDESTVTGDVLNGRTLQAVATDRSLLPVLYGEGAMFYRKDPKNLQLKFHHHDSSFTHRILADMAEKAGADIVVNVQGYFKGDKFGTTAELGRRVRITD